MMTIPPLIIEQSELLPKIFTYIETTTTSYLLIADSINRNTLYAYDYEQLNTVERQAIQKAYHNHSGFMHERIYATGIGQHFGNKLRLFDVRDITRYVGRAEYASVPEREPSNKQRVRIMNELESWTL